MVILQAIFLGIIEGLTEFLPISSTGHLIIAQNAIGYKDTSELFTVVIQSGAIAAVLWYFRLEIMQKISDLFAWNKQGIRFWQNLIIASIPATLAGVLIASSLSDLATLPVIASSLILGGLAILYVERRALTVNKKPSKAAGIDAITSQQAFKVGLFQVLALVPGVSRSGSTIMGGLYLGLDRVTATAFSFYLSIPILVMATTYKLISDSDKLATISGGGAALVVGTLAAFVTSFIVVKWLLQYVSRNSFKAFAYYRIGLGAVILLVMALAK